MSGFLLVGLRYNLTEKSRETLYSCFKSVKEFLYHDDWIECLAPLYKRGITEDVTPQNPDYPETLDQRHRVYGHCKYLQEEF